MNNPGILHPELEALRQHPEYARLSAGGGGAGEWEVLLKAAFDLGAERAREESRTRILREIVYFRHLMDLLPDYVYFKDLQSRFVTVNLAHARHLGLSDPTEAVGKSDFDFFEPEFAANKFTDEQEIIRSGRGWFFREEHHWQTGGVESWVVSTKLPLRDENGRVCGTFGLSRDITEKKRIDLELERQRVLLNTIIEILPCRLFVRDAEGRFLLINEEYRSRLGVADRAEVEGRCLTDFIDNEKVRAIEAEDRNILHTGRAVRNEVQFDASPLQSNRWILTSKVPLRGTDGKVNGLVGMTLDITEQKEAEMRAQVAQQALLEKNMEMEAELQVARQLQERLLSVGYEKDGAFRLRESAWWTEARYLYQPSHHLAGDFFFLLPFARDKLGIIICDVLGHGVKAALVTMLIRGLLLEVPQILDQPAEVLSLLNRKLYDLAREPHFPRFITGFYGYFNLADGTFSYTGAGHPPPLWWPEGEGGPAIGVGVLPMEAMGPAMGLLREPHYTVGQVAFQRQTTVFLYTDGLVETQNMEGEEFGMQRLVEALGEVPSGLPLPALERLGMRLRQFSLGKEYDDDVCLVAVQVRKEH